MTFCKHRFFFKQVSIKFCLSLNPPPLFLRGGVAIKPFFLNPLVLPGGFSPFFSLRKKEATTTSPRTTWWITQYTSLPPRDESFLRVADTLGLGLVEIAEPKRGWVMNLGGWWVKCLGVGFGEGGWGWWGGCTHLTFELWSFHGVDCLGMRDLGNKKGWREAAPFF